MTSKLLGHFEEQYQQVLGKVQQDLHELQVQTGRVQVSVGQASGVQESLHQVRMSVLDMEKTFDLCISQLAEGALCAKSEEATTQLLQIKNLALKPHDTPYPDPA